MSAPRFRLRPILRPIVAALLLAACGSGDGGQRPEVGSEVGQRAPILEGTTATGGAFRLEYEGPRVLVFYRSVECGLCRERLRRLQEHRSEYARLGADAIAVTGDPPGVAARTARELGLDLEVLSVDAATLERWGVRSDSAAGPLPAAFLVDDRGVIRFRHLGRDAGDRIEDAALLAELARFR